MLTNVSYMILWIESLPIFDAVENCIILYDTSDVAANTANYNCRFGTGNITFMIPGEFTLTNQLAAELLAPRKCNFLYILYHI